MIGDSNPPYLEIAKGDLRRCVGYDLRLHSEDPLLPAIRDQFIPNIAGYEVLAFLLGNQDKYVQNEWPHKAQRQVMVFWENERFPHPLLAAELAGYAWLTEERLAGKRLKKKENWNELESYGCLWTVLCSGQFIEKFWTTTSSRREACFIARPVP